MLLDLGSLAKGYIADKLRMYCHQNHAVYALINLGGNIVTYGASPKHQDGFWRIGIRDPKEQGSNHWRSSKSRMPLL